MWEPHLGHILTSLSPGNSTQYRSKQNKTKKSQLYDLSHKLLYFHAKNQLNFPSVHELLLKKNFAQTNGWMAFHRKALF